jgi:hypothetical protein
MVIALLISKFLFDGCFGGSDTTMFPMEANLTLGTGKGLCVQLRSGEKCSACAEQYIAQSGYA